MRLFVSLLLLASAAMASPDPGSPANHAANSQVIERIPLRFEKNLKGEWTARSLGFSVKLDGETAGVNLGKDLVGVEFAGGNSKAAFVGEEKSATPTNYFVGQDFYAADAFLRLRQSGVYPGIDVIYYGVGQSLEYDFELSANADPSQIRMRFPGAQDVELQADGSLLLHLTHGAVTQKAPVTYQRVSEWEVAAVSSRYVREADGTFSLKLGSYDEDKPLVVDPQLMFTAYLAGTGAEFPVNIGLDANGVIYVTGNTRSDNFPLVGEAFDGFFETPELHTFTTKLDLSRPAADVITYSGYFGGFFGDTLKAAVVSSDGVLYMTGLTVDKLEFPITPNAYSNDNKDSQKMFVAQLDTNIPGKAGLKYATFFGSSNSPEEPTAIALGNAPGLVFITGFTQSDEYPVKNAIQDARKGFGTTTTDAFLALFDLNQSGANSLVASTYLGGSVDDYPRSMAVDAENNVYLGGYTQSFDYPITSGALQAVFSGGFGDGFLTKLNLTSKTILYSSYFGGPGIDRILKVLLDGQGRVAVGGYSTSTNLPLSVNALQSQQKGEGDVFLAVLDLDTQNFSEIVQYSTLFGGSDGEYLYDMALTPSGSYVLGGYTLSRDLPVLDALKPASAFGGVDGFVAIIETTETPDRALIYSSYVTGPGQQVVNAVTADNAGNIYVTGQSVGNVFDAGQAAPPEDGNSDVYLFVFRPSAPAANRSQSKPASRNSRVRR